jgi:RNA recognition motif-containing protein
VRIYLGNIPFGVSEQDICDFFAPTVLTRVTIVTDRDTGRPRGFAFVEIASRSDGEAAVARLHQTDFGGRRAIVNEAIDKPRAGGPGERRNGKGGGAGGGGKSHRGSEDRGRRRRDDWD